MLQWAISVDSVYERAAVSPGSRPRDEFFSGDNFLTDHDIESYRSPLSGLWSKVYDTSESFLSKATLERKLSCGIYTSVSFTCESQLSEVYVSWS